MTHLAPSTIRRLTADEAIELASYLSALARGGLPMGDGVRAVARDMRPGRLRDTLEALAARLASGHSLESSLEALGAGLPGHVRELIVAGARSGRLAETLDGLLAHQRSMDDMRRRLWQVAAYPTLLLAFLLAWLMFVALWMVPEIEMADLLVDASTLSSVTQQEPKLPGHARRLLEFARVGPTLVVVVLCGVLVTLGAAAAIGGRAMLSRMLAYVPLLGPAWWYRSLVEFSALAAIFLRQQLPLAESLRLTSLAARDGAIRAAAACAAEDAARGSDAASCLAGQTVLPPTLVNVVDWGSRHGALADSLEAAAEMYRERFELQLWLMRIVFPPVIFLLVAASVFFVVYGWMSSITQMLVDLS